MEGQPGGRRGHPELRQVLDGQRQVGWCVSGGEDPTHLPLPLPPGGSMWRLSSTFVACATQPPARRSWRWPGTWSCRRGEPCCPLGTAPSSQTSPCPARPSAWAFLSSWATSPSPGWPGPIWPVCPGLRPPLCPHCGPRPGPDAEGPPALLLSSPIFAADKWPPARPPPNSLPGTTDPWDGKSLRGLPGHPKLPVQKGNRGQREQGPSQGRGAHSQNQCPSPVCGGWCLESSTEISPAPRPPPFPHLKVWPSANVLRNV